MLSKGHEEEEGVSMPFLKKLLLGADKIGDCNWESNSYDVTFFEMLKKVWSDKTSYGLERLLRFFLVLLQGLFPTLFIHMLARRIHPLWRKLTIDVYVTGKFFWLLLVILTGWYEYVPVVFFTIYLMAETVFYILGMIVLSDIYSHSVTLSRSMIMLMFNYLQVVFCFAIVYVKYDLLNSSVTPLSAIYFSLATMTTVGYGDYYPQPGLGQAVVIIQMVVFVLFMLVFVNYFTSGIRETRGQDT